MVDARPDFGGRLVDARLDFGGRLGAGGESRNGQEQGAITTSERRGIETSIKAAGSPTI